jgi:hypothetical protein
MRTITTRTGEQIEIGDAVDVLAIIEAVYHTQSRESDSYAKVHDEFQHLVGQLSDAECRTYLVESLFMSYNNLRANTQFATEVSDEQLDRLMKKLGTTDR